jgi:sugar phosphate isomerase/epimerase
MRIGAMNHPQHDVLDEIRWMAEMGLDFIDLTLEPPAAATWRVKPGQIRAALNEHGLGVVGHTAYYLPIGHPFESVRQAAAGELRRCLEVFAEIGCPWMNVHPDRHTPMHSYRFAIEQNLNTLRELLEAGKSLGVGVMVENLPSSFNTVEELGDLLGPLPELGLHLDIGHANLHVDRNMTEPILAAFGPRLRHVHLHDNKGGSADLHLPLGAGTLEVTRHVRALKMTGYDGTITLEVFSPDRFFLAYSRDLLRRLWNADEVATTSSHTSEKSMVTSAL